jgi:hypothetical protein
MKRLATRLLKCCFGGVQVVVNTTVTLLDSGGTLKLATPMESRSPVGTVLALEPFNKTVFLFDVSLFHAATVFPFKASIFQTQL